MCRVESDAPEETEGGRGRTGREMKRDKLMLLIHLVCHLYADKMCVAAKCFTNMHMNPKLNCSIMPQVSHTISMGAKWGR